LESLSSFWARVDRFTDLDFLAEFRPKGGLARAWTVRSTMHTFPAKDYYVHVFGSGKKRILSRYESWAKRLGMPPRAVRTGSLYQPLLDQMKGKQVTSSYVKQYMEERVASLGLKSRMKLGRGWSSQATYGPTWMPWGLIEMSLLGLLVSSGRKGSEGLWMRTSDWLNSGRKVPEMEDCITGLLRRYIQQYGPVSRSDIAYWNNGLYADELDGSLDALRKDLAEHHFEGEKEPFYSFEDGLDHPEPPHVIVLPEFDSLMMGYRDRSRFLSQDKLGHVSRPQGIISRTILVDGFVAATWGKKREGRKTLVSVLPFRDLGSRERRSIEEEFDEYGLFLKTPITVEFRGKAARARR